MNELVRLKGVVNFEDLKKFTNAARGWYGSCLKKVTGCLESHYKGDVKLFIDTWG